MDDDKYHRSSTTEESMLESSSDNLHDTVSGQESDAEPMDISKTTTTTADSDARSPCSSPDNNAKYFCPICSLALTSQHEFTLHIRSHNNDEIISDKGFTCRICSKVLSSSSSLDRHMLVHSGERPFSCKICSVTFTTNGNMHRHMRTHSHKIGDNYESDASTDSNASITSNGRTRKRRLEFNNNNNNNKRKSDSFTSEDDIGNRTRKTKSAYNNINNNNNNDVTEVQKFHCPVCDREDFASLNVLEVHLEDNHPDYEVRCNSCNLSFKNHRALNLHRYMVHQNEHLNNVNINKFRNSIVGFKDLTFVDFSSEKFPHIARYACERSLHKPVSGQKFVCEKCTLAFPCASALHMHQVACLRNSYEEDIQNPTDLSKKSTDEDIRRENFFAHLDLQNKSPPPSPEIRDAIKEEDEDDAPKREELLRPVKEEPESIREEPIPMMMKPHQDSKDLADIQSILSMASNDNLLRHLRAKPSSELMPQDNQHQEEESQDVFAAEFRKMKLRGEFPCRLCTSVFPNLRALKGHNRAHLGNGNTGPYRCNMCPHSSIDKAALIRHMRTHNGDRPYECSLCNYAFTTKANCERHLRNRHAKVTREEVKRAIIYHPSEDPTNEDSSKYNSIREEPKKSFMSTPIVEELDKINSSIPKETITPPTLVPKEVPMNILLPKEQPMPKELRILKDSFPTLPSAFPFVKRGLDGLKQIPDFEEEDECNNNNNNQSSSSSSTSNNFPDYPKPSTERPIDLSMDVLDLSKKKESPKEEEPHDFTKKTLESNVPMPSSAAQLLLAQQLLKNGAANFYASQISQYYQNTSMIPGLNIPSLPINPFFFPAPFLNGQAAQEMKERMLRLHLQSGGTIITDQLVGSSDRMPQFNHVAKPTEEIKPPLHINTALGDSVGKLQSPKAQKTPELSSPNSVKMVIKNGVLMPKQKQRRYRTERPFSCEHCSARFTLRSNMERHIKQQHPQFWSQRQRSMNSSGRKPAQQLNTPPKAFYDLNIPNIPNYDMYGPKIESETKDRNVNLRVSNAILAQQLNRDADSYATKEKPEEVDDDALVIDEEEDKAAKIQAKEETIQAPPIETDCNSKKSLDEKMLELRQLKEKQMQNEKTRNQTKSEEGQDLVPVSRLLDNAVSSRLPFREYFKRDGEENDVECVSEEEEEGFVVSGSTSEGNISGSDENRSENETAANGEPAKKKSAYSLAPNRVTCPYCNRKFPWTSSLRRHILTHTGQKPFKCSQCPLLFTTKSNCDRHLLRKHGNNNNSNSNTSPNSDNGMQNYMMRNVPERPYKCSNCPSSTFSTLSNLKKHMSCKHTTEESHSSEEDAVKSPNDWESQISHTKTPQTQSSDQTNNSSSDLPFKCHLCEGSFSERQEALDHIRDMHVSEYELLMSKGALEQASGQEDPLANHETEEDDQLRGKFPDYANRKVMCAFCMRRFWSAEDLRRHMRTHTGERPFSCDVCRRRFTLKHSMLRHRKKHNLGADENVMISGDEDVSPTTQLVYTKVSNNNNNNNNNVIVGVKDKSEDESGNEGNDLIGNLLGIRDKSIIDQVLVSSADDAAKLLGVKSGRE